VLAFVHQVAQAGLIGKIDSRLRTAATGRREFRRLLSIADRGCRAHGGSVPGTLKGFEMLVSGGW